MVEKEEEEEGQQKRLKSSTSLFHSKENVYDIHE